MMCTGPWRATRPRAPCWKRGPPAQPDAGPGSELPLGRQRGRAGPAGALQPRCFPASALVSRSLLRAISCSCRGGGSWSWAGKAGPCWGLGQEGGTAPRKQRPREGGSARSSLLSPSSPVAAPLHFLGFCLASRPAPGQASAGERRGQALGAGRHTCPPPSHPVSISSPTLHVQPPPRPTHPTHATASTSPHTDERIENKEPLWTSPHPVMQRRGQPEWGWRGPLLWPLVWRLLPHHLPAPGSSCCAPHSHSLVF